MAGKILGFVKTRVATPASAAATNLKKRRLIHIDIAYNHQKCIPSICRAGPNGMVSSPFCISTLMAL